MPKWNNAKVIKIENETAVTKRFWLQAEEGGETNFIPGQFITLDLPIHETRQKRWRSYSIANAPSDTGVFELCIVKLEGGLGTTYLFDSIVVGSDVIYKKPAGVFTLRKPIDRDLVMICTGTGVAPFRSMIQDIYMQKIPHQNIHLIFGTRKKEDVLYLEEFQQLAEQEDSFSYSVALSRQELLPKDSSVFWHKGYVHPIYLEQYKDLREDIQFLICGWQNMVDEAEAELKSLGYSNTQVKLELYG